MGVLEAWLAFCRSADGPRNPVPGSIGLTVIKEKEMGHIEYFLSRRSSCRCKGDDRRFGLLFMQGMPIAVHTIIRYM